VTKKELAKLTAALRAERPWDREGGQKNMDAGEGDRVARAMWVLMVYRMGDTFGPRDPIGAERTAFYAACGFNPDPEVKT
jgi:hypothetical protein